MKKTTRIIRNLTLSTLLLLCSANILAQLTIQVEKTHNDSVAFVRESSNSHPGGWNFDVIGMDIMNIGFSNKKKSTGRKYYHSHSKWVMFDGWGFGFNNAVNTDANVNVDMGRSFNFCIEDLVAYRVRVSQKGAFSMGMGIDLKNYHMTGTQRFVEDPVTKMITVSDYPAGTVPGTSKIRTFSTTYNMKYIQKLGRFRLALGPELTVVRKPAKKHIIRTTYTDSQGEQVERFTGIRTNKVGLNLVGVLSYRNRFGVYAKYGLTDVLNTSFGPKFKTLSVGLMVLGL